MTLPCNFIQSFTRPFSLPLKRTFSSFVLFPCWGLTSFVALWSSWFILLLSPVIGSLVFQIWSSSLALSVSFSSAMYILDLQWSFQCLIYFLLIKFLKLLFCSTISIMWFTLALSGEVMFWKWLKWTRNNFLRKTKFVNLRLGQLSLQTKHKLALLKYWTVIWDIYSYNSKILVNKQCINESKVLSASHLRGLLQLSHPTRRGNKEWSS